MSQRDTQRSQMVADLELLDQVYGDVTEGMIERASIGLLTIDEIAEYEESHGLTFGITLITSAYMDSSFLSDARIALARDPALDMEHRELALHAYDVWSQDSFS